MKIAVAAMNSTTVVEHVENQKQSYRQTKYYPSNCNKNIYLTLRCVYLRIETPQCIMYNCVHGDFDLPRPKELLVLSHSLNLSITCCLLSHFRTLSLLISFVKGEAAVLSDCQ